jgi:hypothetical protein
MVRLPVTSPRLFFMIDLDLHIAKETLDYLCSAACGESATFDSGVFCVQPSCAPVVAVSFRSFRIEATPDSGSPSWSLFLFND